MSMQSLIFVTNIDSMALILAGAVAAVASLYLYLYLNVSVRSQHRDLVETSATITAPYLPCDQLVIAHLSDFHAEDGGVYLGKLLEQAEARLQQLRPDVIALTGDYVNRRPEPVAEVGVPIPQRLELPGSTLYLDCRLPSLSRA